MPAAHLEYQSGFLSHFATEALPGALPIDQNSPQRCAYGLYAEQFSGSAFTAPRQHNRFSWLYRIRPSVVQSDYRPMRADRFISAPHPDALPDPNQMRWDPQPEPDGQVDFVDGFFTLAVNGDAGAQRGCGVHLYACNQDMVRRFFYDADGELLIVPQQGALQLRTELGVLNVSPGEIALVPRGCKFQVRLQDGAARGYICENYGTPFELPAMGAIGANGLANPRHFLAPVAAYDDEAGEFSLLARFGGRLWETRLDHSPLDVVAWHGNLTPCKYDLALFNTLNTVSFDHPDPSIFTVLTSTSDTPGVANVDFVIFPPRWMVAEHSFRPPYFHRNLMSEFMGLIKGQYDAKAEGFVPGGSSLHNCMSPHGPDVESFDKASQAELKPQYLGDTLAFMFESRYVFQTPPQAREADFRQRRYTDIWSGLERRFSPDQP